jgi:hypothetical protein
MQKSDSISPPFYSPRCKLSRLHISIDNNNKLKPKNSIVNHEFNCLKKKMSTPSPNEILLNNLLSKDFVMKNLNHCQKKIKAPLSQRSNYTENFNDHFCECFFTNENVFGYFDEESDKENFNCKFFVLLDFLRFKKRYTFLVLVSKIFVHQKTEKFILLFYPIFFLFCLILDGNYCYTERNDNKFVRMLISQNKEIKYLKGETQELKRNINKLQQLLYKNAVLDTRNKKMKEGYFLRSKFREEEVQEEGITEQETEKKIPSKSKSNSKINFSEFLSPPNRKEYLTNANLNLKMNPKAEKNQIEAAMKKNFSIIEHLKNKGINIEPKVSSEQKKAKNEERNIPETLQALKERMGQILNNYKTQTLESRREKKRK